MSSPEAGADFLLLRRVTRALAERLDAELRGLVATVSPLFEARVVYGSFLRGGAKEPSLATERAFTTLRDRCVATLQATPFGVPGAAVTAPIESPSLPLELHQRSYRYVASARGIEKTLTIVQPLSWVLTYRGGGVLELARRLGETKPDPEAIRALVVEAHALEGVVEHRAGLTALFDRLRFALSVRREPRTGQTPVVCIDAPVPTVRPDDAVIVETTEISGAGTFHEVVDPAAIRTMEDPVKSELVAILAEHGLGG